jgi:hypothetical protein|tara:strand:- start:56 stop:2308 length:2253 start_codon:yes stop_codon:yes gene_type:complete
MIKDNHMKLFFKFFLFLLVISSSIIIFLSYVGYKTDRFDLLIQKKSNKLNNYVKIEFNKTRTYLSIPNLELIVKLQNPKILIKNKEINLSKLNFSLSLKSFYKSEFILKKANIGFQKNDIKDLTKVTNIFLPKIINKQLKKVFEKGNLEGEFVIPFNSDGSVSKNYTFNGNINKADINFLNSYKLQDLNAEIAYGKSSQTENDALKITIKKGLISNLTLLESSINIKFADNKKKITSTIHSTGELNNADIQKISYLLGIKIKNLENINLESNLITKIQFDLDRNFRIKNTTYGINGDIKKFQFKTKKKDIIKNFLPSFNPNIVIKNAKVAFLSTNKEESFKLEGDAKFSKHFEKFKFLQILNRKNKKYAINISASLNESAINLNHLNYKKKVGQTAQIDLNIDLLFDKYFLIKSLNYADNNSKITLNKIKLNNNLEIVDFSDLKIKTYIKNIKNNDFSIKKLDKIVINGEILDAQPLFKSLFTSDNQKILSDNFNSDITANIKKVISGIGDEVFDLAIIATIKNGSYSKLSLKGNYSINEIVEMSIYQVDSKTKTIQVISDRARPFVKHFDFIQGFEGGKLVYDSNILSKKSFSNLSITNFKVSKVSALAQLLTLASFQGIADTLNGEGIRFDSFEMKSYTEGNVMNIEDALAIGPAVSILLDGYVDKGNIISLRGTLVPATKLNSIIASIPIVGGILVGSKTGDGIVGVSFKMKGPPKDIKTTVNPIKTLTPRFIVRAVEKMKKREEVK